MTAKRDAAKKALLQCIKTCSVTDDTPWEEAHQSATELKRLYDAFVVQHKAVLDVTGPAEYDFQLNEGAIVEQAFLHAQDVFLRLRPSTGTIPKSPSIGLNPTGDDPVNSLSSTEDLDGACGGAYGGDNLHSTGGSASNKTSRKDAIYENNVNDAMVRNLTLSMERVCARAIQSTVANTASGIAHAQVDMLEHYWASYMKATLCDWNVQPGDDYIRIETQFLRAKGHLARIIEVHAQPRNPANNHNRLAAEAQGNDLKLSPISIPKFSGNYKTWLSFFDLFSSMVHNVPHLSDVKKMHYLKSSVEGEAENLIRSYAITEANYLVAWNALQERYNNRRLIINAHLDQLMMTPSVKDGSAAALRRLADSCAEAVRALAALGQPTGQWDVILVHTLVTKLDPASKRNWEMSLANDDLPTFAMLLQFLERRCRSLDAAGAYPTGSTGRSHTQITSGGDVRKIGANANVSKSSGYRQTQRSTFVATSKSPGCVVCKKADHNINACPIFGRMYTGLRYQKVKELRLCFNCLRGEHRTVDCKSPLTCRKCERRHHTMLHYDEKPAEVETEKAEVAVVANVAHARQPTTHVLLATAVAHIVGSDGAHHPVRILLDSGSQTTFVTEACVRRLGLLREKASIPVAGLGQNVSCRTRGKVGLNLHSIGSKCDAIFVQAFILQRITHLMPSSTINKRNIPFLSKLTHLADPKFDIPGEIDILLGADILGALMLDKKVHSKLDKALFAQNTALGWVVSGPIPVEATCSLHTTVAFTSHLDLEQALERFWLLEEVEPFNAHTLEEMACEKHFANCHRRLEHGRYIVELPFRENAQMLGDSHTSALRSLHSLERRFEKHAGLRQQYSKFLDEYLQLGHMTLVTTTLAEGSSFYLPHHPVFKAESTSTKIRVVFDASRKTSTGVSLNDILMVGPKLQQNLVDILLRFRGHRVAFCGDLVKMYRQVRTTPASSEFQRILWRNNPHEEVKTYRLDTVTYGTASASYLATKALQQLAIDEESKFPLASKVALTDFYVDDIMTGCDNIEEAITLQKQLIGLTNAGGFQLSKWASNANALLESVPAEQREINCPLEIHCEQSIKTLGLSWNPSLDCFQYRVKLPAFNPNTTKRIVLSEVASLFDPLGLLAPVIIAAKIFMQLLWAEHVTWDEPLSPTLATRYENYRNDLVNLHALNIPRWLGLCNPRTYQIHGFCDASEAAYAAVVYLRSTDSSGESIVRIVTARTKVAPLKKISLPRLELCGAVLLAKLMVHVKSALNQTDIETFAWCDSTVTLAWIRKSPHTWHTFVANRVSAIHSHTPCEIWQHVPGTQNPADVASRGILASALVNDDSWWCGPSWLVQSQLNWPKSVVECVTDIDAKPNVTNLHLVTENSDWMERYSSFSRLRHAAALILRFWFNCTHKSERRSGPLTTLELLDATNRLVRATQAAEYTNEINILNAGKLLVAKAPLKTLVPFLDDDKILRVGGRLGNAHIAYAARHQAILPKGSHLAKLLVAHAHHQSLHGGPQITIATLRQEYWIVSARSAVKKYIRSCTVCIRHNKSRGQQMMAPLPSQRTQATRAFLTAGVDYAGPITIKLQPGRGTKTSKAYIALFVCFSTKALHLELVSSLTTDAFLAAFRRFVARRGKCAHLYSDCGTNFVGAWKELRTLQHDVLKQFNDNMLAKRLAVDDTQWHFNPPGAPNFGGIWEAGVKSVKHHLRRILGTSLYTFEELATILAQIEAVLNSRPICPLSDDANDPQALTPGHFLIGEPMTAVPNPIMQEPIAPLKRWQLVQQATLHFWNRWRSEYITTLQQRTKWTKRDDNIELGTLALIVDENMPPAKWSLGRVVELHPGADGIVRVVTLKANSKLIKRPLVKLCPFPKLEQ